MFKNCSDEAIADLTQQAVISLNYWLKMANSRKLIGDIKWTRSTQTVALELRKARV